jgi:hypothetical protein
MNDRRASEAMMRVWKLGQSRRSQEAWGAIDIWMEMRICVCEYQWSGELT